MKSVIPARFHKTYAFVEGRSSEVNNMKKIRNLVCSGVVQLLVCFTSCTCGNQVDGSPHVVHTEAVVASSENLGSATIDNKSKHKSGSVEK